MECRLLCTAAEAGFAVAPSLPAGASFPSLEQYDVGRVDNDAIERMLPDLTGREETVSSEREEVI